MLCLTESTGANLDLFPQFKELIKDLSELKPVQCT